jgi:hypothetical protein
MMLLLSFIFGTFVVIALTALSIDVRDVKPQETRCKPVNCGSISDSRLRLVGWNLQWSLPLGPLSSGAHGG